MGIRTLITNLINSLLDGSFERVRIISQMNTAFKEYFTTGEFSRLCGALINMVTVDVSESSVPISAMAVHGTSMYALTVTKHSKCASQSQAR